MVQYSIIRARRSIVRDYAFLFGITIGVILLFIYWFIVYTYNSQQKILDQQLLSKAHRLNAELTSSLDYTANLMHILGEEISQHPSDLEHITKVLRNPIILNESAKQLSTWALFDWSNSKNQLIASTMIGKFKTPVDISRRNFTKSGKAKPWVLFYDKPDIGIVSGEFIIPTGMGVYDVNNKYVGTISTGFSIAKLQQRFRNITGDSTHFIILDKNDHQVLFASTNNESHVLQNISWSDVINKQPKQEAAFLSSPIETGQIIYEYFDNLEKHPYTIVIGYDQVIARHTFYQVLLPGILGLSIIGIVVCFALVWLRYLLVIPITRLSLIAEAIINDKPIPRMKGWLTHETLNLAVALLKIKRLINREKYHKAALANAINIARSSDVAKEKFVVIIKKYIKQKIQLLIQDINALYDSTTNMFSMGKPNIKWQQQCLENMLETVKGIQVFEVKAFSQVPINVKEVINECIVIVAKQALLKNIKIVLMAESNFPKLITDEVCFKQVIVSLISQAIDYSPDNIEVLIKVTLEESVNNTAIIIQVEDKGFGFTQEYIQQLSIQANDSRYEDGTNISLLSVKQLVNLLGGTSTIYSTLGKGTVVRISFPLIRQQNNTSTKGNVVPFSNL